MGNQADDRWEERKLSNAARSYFESISEIEIEKAQDVALRTPMTLVQALGENSERKMRVPYGTAKVLG